MDYKEQYKPEIPWLMLGTLSVDTTIAFGQLLTSGPVSGGMTTDSFVSTLVSISSSKFQNKNKNLWLIWLFLVDPNIYRIEEYIKLKFYPFITC